MSGNRKPNILISWWFAILEAVLVRYVKVTDQWLQQVKEASQNGSIVFILRNRNLIDFLCLRGICKRHGLPPLGFVSGLSVFSFVPVWKIVLSLFVRHDEKRQQARLVNTLKKGGCAIVFLRRPALRNALGSRPTATNGIRLAIEAQKHLERSVIALPTVFLWGEAPMRRTRSNLSYIFGTSEYPRLLRSIWLLIRRRSVHEIISEKSINIEQLTKDRGDDTERLLGIIRATVGRSVEAIRTRKLGSFKKTSSRVKFEVAQSHRLKLELEKIASSEQIPFKEIAPRTKTIIDKLATEFKPHVLAASAVLAIFLWKKLFSGLEIPKQDLDKIRSAVGKGPLLLIPCHRSHIDYLAISETMNSANIMLPHIAAGDNLAFWPMGFFFRSCGAFFIRRRFVNDKFYRAIVNAYIRKLIQEKYAIEVFIEGGRSRTGKMLRPQLGMLEMALNAMASIPGRNPGVLPIFIGYDRVIEEDAYVRESLGKKKRKENVIALLKSAKVLTNNYGKLYVRSGNFFTIGDVLKKTGRTVEQLAEGSIRRAVAQEIGRKTLLDINANAVVTLNAIVATALLFRDAPPPTHEQLFTRCHRLIQILQLSNIEVSPDAMLLLHSHLEGEIALQKSLETFKKDKRIYLKSSSMTIEVKASGRMNLDYYKNTAIHFFAPAALLAPPLLAHPEGCTQELLLETICMISKLYKWEFLLPDVKKCSSEEIENVMKNGISLLENAGIIKESNKKYTVVSNHELRQLAEILRTYHEIYHCALVVSRQKVIKKNITNTIIEAQKRFDTNLKTGYYHMPEGQNRIVTQSAFSALKELKLNRPGPNDRPYDEGGIGDYLINYLESLIVSEPSN